MNFDEPGIHAFIGFRGTSIEEELRDVIREIRPGGIVLFRRNIEGPGQVRNLVAGAQELAHRELKRPLLVAIDQEGGTVQRLVPHFTNLPAARELGGQTPSEISRWAEVCARDLRDIGIQINLAPVLDIVPAGENHFMESRTFGSSPGKVSEAGRTWLEALQRNGISATAKHFPGLGRAQRDPHHFSPIINGDTTEEFRKHIIPFHAAVTAGVNCVMTSHAVYPAIDPGVPATLSREINRGWLREKLRFGGVLFSDDLDMAAIKENYTPDFIVERGLSCSTDFFLLCQNSESLKPFSESLNSHLRNDSALRDVHAESLVRIEMLYRFHFGQEFAG
ncbi:MAG: beta-N-acetylhexosaminidase [Desulfobacteraceae bacterium]|nr:beta-N-acetylhexosaminidase [Desulfobacteraceae bacterium]